MDWQELLKHAGPGLGLLVAKGGPEKAAFMQAFIEGQQLATQEQARKDEEARRKAQAGAHYSQKAFETLSAMDDPEQFYQQREEFKRNAPVFDLDPSVIDRHAFPEANRLSTLQKKAQTLLDNLVQANGPDILQANVTVKFDGRDMPIRDLKNIVGMQATDQATGQPYKRTKPRSELPQPGSFEDFVGAPPERQDQITQARQAYTGAGRAQEKSVDPLDAQKKKTDLELALARLEDLKNPKPKAGASEPLVQVQTTDPDTGEIVTSLVPRRAGEVGRKPPPAPKDPNQAQFAAAGYAGRMEQAEPILSKLERDVSGMNVISYETQIKLPAALQSAQIQSYMQAARNFINAVLRRESGAVISPDEFKEARQQYLPQPGDEPAVLAQKQQNRSYVAQTVKRASGSAYEAPVKPPTSGAGPTVGERRMINGKLGEWDGKGWKAVQ